MKRLLFTLDEQKVLYILWERAKRKCYTFSERERRESVLFNRESAIHIEEIAIHRSHWMKRLLFTLDEEKVLYILWERAKRKCSIWQRKCYTFSERERRESVLFNRESAIHSLTFYRVRILTPYNLKTAQPWLREIRQHYSLYYD